MPFNDLPLDLPHAGTIAERIARYISQKVDEGTPAGGELLDLAEQLAALLFRYSATGENPAESEAIGARDEAADIARRIVDGIETMEIGFDRLGQSVRNLFECLELGEEGMKISLRAGEDPNSLQRP